MEFKATNSFNFHSLLFFFHSVTIEYADAFCIPSWVLQTSWFFFRFACKKIYCLKYKVLIIMMKVCSHLSITVIPYGTVLLLPKPFIPFSFYPLSQFTLSSNKWHVCCSCRFAFEDCYMNGIVQLVVFVFGCFHLHNALKIHPCCYLNQ